MVAEFKKEAVLKEIGRLSVELEHGQKVIEEAKQKEEAESKVLSNLGITIDHVSIVGKLMLRYGLVRIMHLLGFSRYQLLLMNVTKLIGSWRKWREKWNLRGIARADKSNL